MKVKNGKSGLPDAPVIDVRMASDMPSMRCVMSGSRAAGSASAEKDQIEQACYHVPSSNMNAAAT